MTGPEENHETRPISVAELLARNGTIGAPPLGGRRRRRRGNTDAVSVAELTGEIPVVTSGEIPAVDDEDQAAHTDPLDLSRTNGTAGPPFEPEPRRYARRQVEDYSSEDDEYFNALRGHARQMRVRAEQMAPDPHEEDDDEHVGGIAIEPPRRAPADEDDDLPSYLREREREHFFGGADPSDDLVTEAHFDEDEVAAEPLAPMDKVLRGGWVVLQSIIAVAFGAGLFMGFDQLWKWNNIVALVLSVLVILGLVVAVRIVRKTEDIGSTLIAVAVGALVTLGPLALLQSG